MATVPATSANLGPSKVCDEALRELEKVLGETIPAPIQQGRETFRRELPALLTQHPGKWAAYSGEQQLGVGATKTELHAECLRRGLQPDQFLVLRIEPQADNDADVPMDV